MDSLEITCCRCHKHMREDDLVKGPGDEFGHQLVCPQCGHEDYWEGHKKTPRPRGARGPHWPGCEAVHHACALRRLEVMRVECNEPSRCLEALYVHGHVTDGERDKIRRRIEKDGAYRFHDLVEEEGLERCREKYGV